MEVTRMVALVKSSISIYKWVGFGKGVVTLGAALQNSIIQLKALWMILLLRNEE
jgi:hypothetical protein